jgi:hypothetical protein
MAVDCEVSHLGRFVEPAVAGVEGAAAAVDHLVQHVGLVPVAHLVAARVVPQDAVVEAGWKRLVHADDRQRALNQLQVVAVCFV